MATHPPQTAFERVRPCVERGLEAAALREEPVSLTDLAGECGGDRALVEAVVVQLRHEASGLEISRRTGAHPGVQWTVDWTSDDDSGHSD